MQFYHRTMPQMSQVLRERAIGMLTARMSTRAVARELNVHFSTISRLQRHFREFGSKSNRPHNRRPRVTTPAQDLHIQKPSQGSSSACSSSSLRLASGTLERCSLHGWIPVFTVQGRWPTACMALCGWAVCWCQRCGSNGPWWRWGYGMGRRMLWTTNTGAFYWWHFECRDTVTRSWGPLLCHSSTTITSCCSMIMHGPRLQWSVHNS